MFRYLFGQGPENEGTGARVSRAARRSSAVDPKTPQNYRTGRLGLGNPLSSRPMSDRRPSDSSNTLVRIQIDGGTGYLAVDLDHPLGAPFRKTARTGGPLGDWRFVLVKSDGELRILGTLVHTPAPGDRLCFFPAFGGGPEEQFHPTDRKLADKQFDHITLEPPNRGRDGEQKSHLTFRNGSSGYGERISAPESHLVPWFSFRFPDLDPLPVAPANLYIEFFSRRVDAEGAVDEYASAIVQRCGLTMLQLRPSPHSETFLSLDIWAGWGDDFENPTPTPMLVDPTAPYIRDLPPNSQEVKVYPASAEFPRRVRVVLYLCHWGGRLTDSHFYQPKGFEPESI